MNSTSPKDQDENYDTRQKGADEKFCSSCGKVIKSEASVCPHCGVANAGKQSVVVGLVIIIVLLAATAGTYAWLYYQK